MGTSAGDSVLVSTNESQPKTVDDLQHALDKVNK